VVRVKIHIKCFTYTGTVLFLEWLMLGVGMAHRLVTFRAKAASSLEAVEFRPFREIYQLTRSSGLCPWYAWTAA
jgi:hypothetical protein